MKLHKFSKLAGFLSVAIIGSSLLTLGCSKDLELEQCKVNYSKYNYSEAFKFCSVAAEQGHAEAQFNLGDMYDNGQGVKQDYFKAVEWYQKAADQGQSDAQFNLGYMYANGRGVKQDYFKAVEWYQKAAEQGNASAQYNLGIMYYDGEGVRQNYTKAKEYFGLACDNKDQDGCDMYKKLNQ